jgi:hypothetical protein
VSRQKLLVSGRGVAGPKRRPVPRPGPFTDELGRPLAPDWLTDHFQWLVKKSGLPPVHDLRHCAVTIMLASGADMKTVTVTLATGSSGSPRTRTRQCCRNSRLRLRRPQWR